MMGGDARFSSASTVVAVDVVVNVVVDVVVDVFVVVVVIEAVASSSGTARRPRLSSDVHVHV
jgi:hypothetical protein